MEPGSSSSELVNVAVLLWLWTSICIGGPGYSIRVSRSAWSRNSLRALLILLHFAWYPCRCLQTYYGAVVRNGFPSLLNALETYLRIKAGQYSTNNVHSKEEWIQRNQKNVLGLCIPPLPELEILL